MYGDGRSEMLVGEAIEGRRNDVFIVTKASDAQRLQPKTGTSARRCDRPVPPSLAGQVPLGETVQTFEEQQRDGKIRHWGVSNFDLEVMYALQSTRGGSAIQTNQVLYNLARRGIESDLLPWLREHRIPVMAFPIEQGRLLKARGLVVDSTDRQCVDSSTAQPTG